MKLMLILCRSLAFSLLLIACNQQQEEVGTEEVAVEEVRDEAIVYEADLSGFNSDVNGGRTVSGTATYEVQDSLLIITVNANGLEPNSMHLQHLHSFEEGKDASCPPGVEADANNDGVIDLIETREYAGITMIPLHDNPTSLEIKTETYPTADAEGKINYQQTVNLDSLRIAFKEKFGLDTLDLSQHVVFIHGVSQNANLPNSAQSLPGVPAHVTLPVACGALNRR